VQNSPRSTSGHSSPATGRTERSTR
jgi:hypothetical protein